MKDHSWQQLFISFHCHQDVGIGLAQPQ